MMLDSLGIHHEARSSIVITKRTSTWDDVLVDAVDEFRLIERIHS